MAKVEMTLAEYNAMKEELDLYKRILKELTTPTVDEWWVNHCKETRSPLALQSRNVRDISNEIYNLLVNMVIRNMPDELRHLGDLEIDKSIGFSNLGYITFPEIPAEVVDHE